MLPIPARSAAPMPSSLPVTSASTLSVRCQGNGTRKIASQFQEFQLDGEEHTSCATVRTPVCPFLGRQREELAVGLGENLLRTWGRLVLRGMSSNAVLHNHCS